jgi:hypothetical protein
MKLNTKQKYFKIFAGASLAIFALTFGMWLNFAHPEDHAAHAISNSDDQNIAGSNTFYAYLKTGEQLRYDFWMRLANANALSDTTVKIIAPDGQDYDYCDYTIGTPTSSTWLTENPATQCANDTLPVATEDGVWRVELASNASIVHHWSIDVYPSDSAGTAIAGRVWTKLYRMAGASTTQNIQNAERSFSLWFVTSDGYKYRVDYRGMNAGGSGVISANKIGLTDNLENCPPAYRSADSGDGYYQAISYAVCAVEPYKIFFEQPAADLPEEVTIGGVNDWVTPSIKQIIIGNLNYTRTTDTTGVLDLAVENYSGAAILAIDVDDDGVFTGALDRHEAITIDADGTASFDFDGLDADGNAIAVGSTVNFQLFANQAGESHWVLSDFEILSGGLTVTKINGEDAGNTTLYWNDTDLSLTSKYCPATPILDGRGGIDSTGGAHGWILDSACRAAGNAFNCSANGCQSWGDARYIENWVYQSVSAQSPILPVKLVDTTPPPDTEEPTVPDEPENPVTPGPPDTGWL